METILITGGAGFIGAHLANELLAAGYHVRALDTLEPQVHGPERRRPAYLTGQRGHRWEVTDADGYYLHPLPTPESKQRHSLGFEPGMPLERGLAL